MSYFIFPRRYRDIGQHNCTLLTEDNWPRLSPRANLFRRTIRKLRDAALPSYWHPKAKYIFSSYYTFNAEKIRMIYHCNPFIIHPYSQIALIREVIVTHTDFLYFIVVVFYTFFKCLSPWTPLYPFAIIHLINIVMSFLLGYEQVKDKQKKIVLEPKQIAKNYAKTFAIFELLMFLLPTLIIFKCNFFTAWANLIMVHIVIMAKMPKFFQSLDTTLEVAYKVPLKYRPLAGFFVFLVCYFHYFTCLIYALPMIINYYFDEESLESISYEISTDTLLEKLYKYLLALHTVFLHFYRCGTPLIEHRIGETVTHIVVLFIMFFLHVNMVVLVLITIKNMNHAENKYSFMWKNIFSYIESRNVTGKMKHKILAHYEYRFQYKYFDEESIKSSLSEHLQYELLLNTCSHLITNVALLRGLSRTTVGRIIAALKAVVFLPNDVIITNHSNPECLYFISYGTVAFYTTSGKEVFHAEDGSVLGVTSFAFNKNNFNCIAATITELYRWDDADVRRVVKKYPELGMRIMLMGKTLLDESKKWELETTDVTLEHVLEERLPKKSFAK